MYKIAHLSDTHISFHDESGNGKKLIELLTDIKDKGCDHIIITGDLVDNPHLKDLLFVREILSHFDLLDSGKLSVIPGNHDIFGGAVHGKMFFRFPLTCKELNYAQKVDSFIDAFKETFPNNNSFPNLKVIDNIAIIGTNSVDVWSEKGNPEGSNGKIDKKNFKKLEKILSSEEVKDKYKIVLIHHYFNRLKLSEEYPAHSLWLRVVDYKMKIYGKKKLIELFKKYKVNLVLHGHSHIDQKYNLKGVSYINSSACCAPITDDQVRKYNIISIPGENDSEKSITVDTITV